MSSDHWRQIELLYHAALEQPSGRRAEFLDSACADEPDLRREVESLLRDGRSGLLDHPAWDIAGTGNERGGSPDDPTPPPAEPLPAPLGSGRVLAGRFRIESFLGRGGMGEVYSAQDLELGGTVALKTIRPVLLDQPESLARFRREVQFSRQVTHPNVCRVFDVGRDTTEDRPLIFFTMEYLSGQTLGDYLRSHGALAAAEALPLARQLASGLDALHERGIVHRDLKPGNTFLVGDEGKFRVVLMDFGLARSTGDASEMTELTRPFTRMGTPAYMAPEQLLGETATGASDIYALGLMLFEMVTCRRLMDLGSGSAMARVAADIRLPEGTRLPPQWEPAIMRCLLRNPNDRPASAAEVVAMLEGPAAGDLQSDARAVQSEPEIDADGKAPPAWKKKNWQRFVLAVLLIFFGYLFGYRGIASRFSGKPAADDHGVSSSAVASLSVPELLMRQDKTGNLDKAMALLEKESADGVGSQAAQLHYERGWADYLRYNRTLDKADLEKARAECLEAIRIDPNLADAHARLSRVYDMTGRPDLAEQEATAALKLDPNNAMAWSAMGLVLSRAGRIKDAEADLQKAVDIAPDDWRQHDTLGDFLRDEGRFDDSRKQLEEAVRLTPDNVTALNDLALVTLGQSRYADAQGLYERAAAIAPSFNVLTGLGTVYMLQGQYPKAQEAFSRATKLNPNSYLGWANLGAAASWSPGQVTQAADAYQKAVAAAERQKALTPNDPKLLAKLGGYYAALEIPDKAIPLLRQAVALDPKSPEVTYRVGEAWEILRRRDDALKWIGRAVQLGYSIEYIRRSPELTGLRADPRYGKIDHGPKQ